MSALDIGFNALGVVGAILLLFGFYRVSSGRWTNKSFWYELDNLVGATCLVIYQIRYHAFVTVVVNAIWAVIALWGLAVFFRRYHLHRKHQHSQTK
jgi:uncharacterized membrane protein